MIHDIEPQDYYTCDCDKYNPDCRCHPKEQVVSDQPYDQEFADAIDAEVDKWAPNTDPPAPTTYYRRKAFTEWYAGWDSAVEVAARIAAERVAKEGGV